ncbi:hypothetical protein NQU47_05590 [Pseudoalteromonas distincta]|uniref:hypothetical protein n=1 Tax=Pseudoalteromonas distincta TaxID=77608 RepID=UPI002340E071|nr:hypothetical protein [Pseudoalteromonas distincta]MDC3212035.1 hypothetical protein [Pseudoalteromonas distincta]
MTHYLKYVFVIMTLAGVNTAYAQAKTQEHYQELEVGVGGNIKHTHTDVNYKNKEFDLHIHPLWESRYVTEGRDNLAGNGIASIATEVNYKNFAVIPWAAKGISSDYSELNLNAIYTAHLSEQIEMYVGYNYIKAREYGIDAHDNELSLDVAYFYADDIQLLSSVYYSFDASGTFLEMAVKKGFYINDLLLLDIQSGVGVNAGYVSDGHNGVNNVKFTANLSYQLFNQLALYTYTSYSIAVNKDEKRFAGDETLRNIFWGGVGLSYQY